MTKTFWYMEDHPHDMDDDFYEFFENFEENVFDTWLTHTFEVVVMDKTINAIRCSVKDNEACFEIWWADCYTRPAGTAKVTCVTELLCEFIDRILTPENYKSSEGKWEN